MHIWNFKDQQDENELELEALGDRVIFRASNIQENMVYKREKTVPVEESGNGLLSWRHKIRMKWV